MRSPSMCWTWKLWSSVAILVALVAAAPPARATVDVDGDGYLEGNDCDDTDDAVWSLPGEAQNLHFTNAFTLSWSWAADLGGTASSAQGDLLRASTPVAFALTGSCSSPQLTVTTATDPSVPVAGHAFFYLVRNRNVCGDGSLGSQSNGTPRSGASCDCSALCSDGLSCTRDRCSNGACAHDPIVTAIQDQPESLAVCPGGSATFRVRGVPDGASPHYQWKKNGANVGTDSPVLTLSGLALADNGAQITCVVTGACAGTTSQTAILTVFPSAASCAGGGTGQGAPNGASEIVQDPTSSLLDTAYAVAGQAFVLDGSRSSDDEVVRTFMWSGEVRLDRNDLSIEGRGLSFAWECTYSSRAERLTPMGWNWDFSYNRYLTIPSSGTIYVFGGYGRRDTYTQSPGGCYTSPGLFRDLCPQSDGSYVLTFADRSTWTFAPLDGSPSQGKWIQERDTFSNDMHATYDTAGRLSAVTDSLGRPITIAYDTDGYISAISDSGGRTITYQRYTSADADGMPGDVKWITRQPVTGTPNGGDFPGGTTTVYTYTKNTGQPALDHNLLSVRPASHTPNQPAYSDLELPLVRNTYTSSTNPADPAFDRVQRQVFGDDPSSSIAYVYAPAVPGEEDPAVRKTFVRDRSGNVSETYFDPANRPVALREYTGRAPNLQVPTDATTNRPTGPLHPASPAYYRTRFTWSADSLITEVAFPDLDKVQLTYDSANADVHLRGNLLQRKRLPGPRGGDQSSTTESWTYTSAFGTEPCPRGAYCPGGGRVWPQPGYWSAWKAVRGGGIRFTENQSAVTASSKAVRGGGLILHESQGVTRGSDARIKVKLPWLGGDDVASAWVRGWDPQKKEPIVRGSALGGLRRSSSCDTSHYGVNCGSPRSFWHTYTDPMGRTSTQNLDAATGAVLQQIAPTVTTGVWGSGTQDISVSWSYNSHGQVVQHIGPTGRVDTATYASSGPAAGYLESVTIDDVSPLPGNHQALLTIMARDQYGNPTAITDPGGNTETFVVDQRDRLVRHVSPPPFSYVTDYRYDAPGSLVRIEEPNLDETGAPRSHPEVAILAGAIDRFGRVGYMIFNGRTLQDPEGGMGVRTEFVYDPSGAVSLTRLPAAVTGQQPTNTVRMSYDERRMPLRVTRAESDPQASTTQWDYDGGGNVVAVREGLESSPRVTTMAYDGYDRLVTATDALGNTQTSHYDANDNLVSTRSDGELIDGESGANVRLAESFTLYDEIDRPVQLDRAFFDAATGMPIGDGASTTRTYYDADSQVSHVQDDNGHVSTMTYDTARRLYTGETPAGNTGLYTYDPNGNVSSVTETEVSDLAGMPPQVYVTTLTHDSLDRVTSSSQSGVTHLFAWDSRSPGPVVHLDGRGNETRVDYDAMGNPTSTRRKLLDTGEAGGNVVGVIDGSLSYDPDWRLASRTDDSGNTTVYTYDPLGRLIATAYADGTLETVSYDVHDNPVSSTDRNGTVSHANFDLKDRPTSRTLVLAPNVLGPDSEVYKYDGLSRLVFAQNNTTHVSRSYDSLSNVTKEVTGGTSLPDLTLTRVCDGRNACTLVTYPSGMTVTTAFDADDRRKTVTTAGPGVCAGGPPPHAYCKTTAECSAGPCVPMPPVVTTYDYTGPTRVVHRANGNGTDTTIAYDDLRRVSRTTHVRTSPSEVIDDRTSEWDASDNRVHHTEFEGGGTGLKDYHYDSANRLVQSVETPPPGTPPTTVDYTLDGVGNRVLVVGGLDPGTYTMSSSFPEPADRQCNQYTATPFDTREYDHSGSLTATPGATLRYDYQGRLVLVSGSSGSGSFTFDALGRRMTANGRRYVYNGVREVEERTATGALRRASVYGNGIDELLSVVADVDLDGNPDRTFYHADDLGDVTAVTGGTGALIEKYRYADFGKPRFFSPTGVSLSQSAIGNPILFNGRRYDAAIGLYDYRSRAMDPRSGRFISSDSIGVWGDDSALGNGFTYAGNNPVSGTDPMGTAKVPRSVIKEYFQAGDKPTTPQFSTLLDSMVNFVEDRYVLGLRACDWRSNWGVTTGLTSGAVTAERKDMLQWYQDMVTTGGSKSMLRSVRGVVEDYRGIQARSGTYTLTAQPGGVRMMKLCPGHISCPTSPPPPEAASWTLNDLICCASSGGLAGDCCERLKKSLE